MTEPLRPSPPTSTAHSTENRRNARALALASAHMRRWTPGLLVAAVGLGLAACGTTEDTPSPPAQETDRAAAPRPADACAEPTGEEKAAVRFPVGMASGERLRDEPWARTRDGKRRYIAAMIDNSGPELIVLVTYADDAKYLSGMRAVNGTARTFTDLPAAGDRMPRAATRALDCLTR